MWVKLILINSRKERLIIGDSSEDSPDNPGANLEILFRKGQLTAFLDKICQYQSVGPRTVKSHLNTQKNATYKLLP